MRLMSETNTVTPTFFVFFANVDLYLTVWQILKMYLRGNILGANVLNLFVFFPHKTAVKAFYRNLRLNDEVIKNKLLIS